MKFLPASYILNKFYTHAGDPSFRKQDGIYNASCPVCREGKSWLKKKRLYFYPTTSSFYCFNCNQSWSALNWIKNISGLSTEEIYLEANSQHLSVDVTDRILSPGKVIKEKPILPHDSINLEDSVQSNYYQNNEVFNSVVKYLKSRRLDSAVNRCGKYYVSLTDHFHKDRLCIPYLDRNNKIIFYQTRSVQAEGPRYLNKIGYEKSVFGIERIDPDKPYIFLFEGPLDAVFIKNGVSLAGLNLTQFQEKQLLEFPFHDRIWVLDNPNIDESSKVKITSLLKNKQKVFRWPTNTPYKDFNEWAVKEEIDEISSDFIMNNLYF
jgi:hypothetical protein